MEQKINLRSLGETKSREAKEYRADRSGNLRDNDQFLRVSGHGFRGWIDGNVLTTPSFTTSCPAAASPSSTELDFTRGRSRCRATFRLREKCTSLFSRERLVNVGTAAD